MFKRSCLDFRSRSATVVPLVVVLGVFFSLLWSTPGKANTKRPCENLQGDLVEMRGAFANPLQRLLRDQVPKGFRIIALSHLGEVLFALEECGFVEEAEGVNFERSLLEAATDHKVHPFRKGPLPMGWNPAKHGLYATHLAILYGVSRRLSVEERAEHLRLVQLLARASLASTTNIVRSYAANKARWPADQSATLFALALYDDKEGTSYHRVPLRKFQQQHNLHLGKNGLPWSEWTGRHSSSAFSRGCALAYTVRYLAPLDAPFAKKLWASTWKHHGESLMGFEGLREWPRGVTRKADADSGPIFFGVGASATAIGRIAASAVGQVKHRAALDSTASWVHRLVAGSKMLRDAEHNILSRALFWAADAATLRQLQNSTALEKDVSPTKVP